MKCQCTENRTLDQLLMDYILFGDETVPAAVERLRLYGPSRRITTHSGPGAMTLSEDECNLIEVVRAARKEEGS